MCRSPSARSVMSIRLWRESCSSIWSRKPMPVWMSYLPVPSRLIAAEMRVSLVWRDTNARRPPVPGVVSAGAAFAGARFGAAFFTVFLAAGRAILGPLRCASFYRKAARTVERDARQDHAQKHDQPAQDTGRRQRIAEKHR